MSRVVAARKGDLVLVAQVDPNDPTASETMPYKGRRGVVMATQEGPCPLIPVAFAGGDQWSFWPDELEDFTPDPQLSLPLAGTSPEVGR